MKQKMISLVLLVLCLNAFSLKASAACSGWTNVSYGNYICDAGDWCNRINPFKGTYKRQVVQERYCSGDVQVRETRIVFELNGCC